MKITLISPYADISSIGVRSVSSYLKSRDISTRLVFMPLQKSFYSREDFSLYPETAVNNLADLVKHDDLIAISLMSNFFPTIKDLTITLKKKLPDKPVLWGGIHPTTCPEMCLDHADYVCVGEGEKTLLDLANAIERGEHVEDIRNLCYLENGEIRRSPLYPLIEDLDEIPSYEHIPANGFVQGRSGDIAPVDRRAMKEYTRFRGSLYGVMTSRGCPFSCTYCCSGMFSSPDGETAAEQGSGHAAPRGDRHHRRN